MRGCLIIVLTAVLLGCGGSVSSAAMLDGTLQYQRTGGIAGVQDKLTLAPSGKATVSTRRGKRSFTLSKTEQSRVKAAVAKANFTAINIRRGGPVSDAFEFQITYLRRNLQFGQTRVPAALQPLVAALQDLVSKHGKK